MSIGRYFTEMLDPSMNWDDVAEMVRDWNGQFCLKGVMSVADVKRDYLFPLATGGQAGVERALGLMREEIERGMKLMGCTSVSQLARSNLRFR